MNEKGRMDDLASLFLPDLLQPLSSDVADVKDDSFMFQERRSNISTPLSTGLGMFMAFPEGDGHEQEEQLNTGQYGLNGATGPILGLPSAQFNPAQFSNSAANYHNKFQPHRYSPFPEVDFSHTLHYAEFIPAEAGFQQPLRRHQRRQMLPVQAAFSPLTVIGQFDGVLWQNIEDGPPQLYGGQNGPDFAVPTQRQQKADGLPRRDNFVNHNDNLGEATVAPPKPQRKKDNSTVENIKFDYSPQLLLRLLQLHANSVCNQPLTDSIGKTISTDFLASLDGRLLTGDQDNYNYLTMFLEPPNEDDVYSPRVISCYRRNFFSLRMTFKVADFDRLLFVSGYPVQRFRIDIGAVAEGKEGETASIIITKDKEKLKKEGNGSDGDNNVKTETKGVVRSKEVLVNITEKSTPIDVDSLGLDNTFWIKKLLYKTATSNSSNINFQTYFRVTAKLIAETASGSHVLHDFIGVPMTVRGRNPSFYQDRKEIRIKTYVNGHDSKTTGTKVQNLAEPSNPQPAVKTEYNDAVGVPQGDAELPGSRMTAGESDRKDLSLSLSTNSNEYPNNALQPAQPMNAKQQSRSVEKMISAKKENGKNYHYFPILSVYYLPPINVVYFPHGAHQDNTNDESSVTKDGDSDVSTPATNTSVEKKRGSKVYFR